MNKRFNSWGRGLLAACVLIAAATARRTDAQPPAPQPVQPAVAEAEIEVLTRGPIHEAFATTWHANPVPGATADRLPPPDIEETPPPIKPTGNNVVWIPGYWAWDGDAKDFLWVSGLWRSAPPQCRWNPGYWRAVDRGAQWYSGFWLKADLRELVYLSEPPRSLERGPSAPGDADSQFYVPGCWEPHESRRRWRTGYWVPYQSGWVWTPARYVATASGYVFVPGYWDHDLYVRAQLFAPIRVRASSSLTSPLRLTPAHVLDVKQLQLHLFARADANEYLFGDYYDARYARAGVRPWYDQRLAPGLADPLLSYTAWSVRRNGTDYVERLAAWNEFFLSQETLRPAATLAGQVELARVQRDAKNLTAALLSTSLEQLTAATPDAFVRLSADDHAALVASTGRLRAWGAERLKFEGAGAGRSLQAAAEQAVQLPVAPLAIPAATLPVAADATEVVDGLLGGDAARIVPAAPTEILREAAPTLAPVENLLPRLPF